VIFAGRLTVEKGVRSLIRAWKDWGVAAPELRLAGDGSLLPELVGMSAGLPIRFLGQLSAEVAQVEIAQARLLILPSECFEGFPMVVSEAFAFGTPAAVSGIGPLPSIVEDGVSGVVFQPGAAASLLREVKKAWEPPGLLERLSLGARKSFEESYTEAANYRILMKIYEHAISTHRARTDIR
jgi:glycosyltransferase involved in cell wall biosynthesis